MIRGLYSSATAMIANSKKLDTIGNNIANAQTPGFKKEVQNITNFEQELAFRMQDHQSVGDIVYGVAPERTVTMGDEGPIDNTGLNTDMAIIGNGFFAVNKGNGVRYTRNGNFSVNAAGYLALPTGEVLQGQNGPVKVDESNFKVLSDGTVFSDGSAVNKIELYGSQLQGAVTKGTDGFFNITGAAPVANGKIQQGSLEDSNVDTIDEITGMMSTSRSFQSCQQAYKVSDQALSQAISQVGSLK